MYVCVWVDAAAPSGSILETQKEGGSDLTAIIINRTSRNEIVGTYDLTEPILNQLKAKQPLHVLLLCFSYTLRFIFH